VPPGWNRAREFGYSLFIAIEQGIQQKVSPLSLPGSTPLLCNNIKSQLLSLLWHSASSGPLFGVSIVSAHNRVTSYIDYYHLHRTNRVPPIMGILSLCTDSGHPPGHTMSSSSSPDPHNPLTKMSLTLTLAPHHPTTATLFHQYQPSSSITS
jgi:hypothetical protein